eukprot:CAMPEP_0171339922 /NCGR_PEP_ID=MMETSP0878-20121228/8242_1 /TAXON_ID=67004 /ORGANISM="Thalassiosira weissflogii, Strain CCMP1336" /LENGTH=35 /DNA_ID= /DNA_START= /DNA_END= /DNA_ORIENTATION=
MNQLCILTNVLTPPGGVAANQALITEESTVVPTPA